MTTDSPTSSIIVSSGVVSSGNVLTSGVSEFVLSGGKAFFTAVSSGGDQIVSAGGLGGNTSVFAGGVIQDAGTLRNALLESGGIALVSGTGAAASATTIDQGGSLTIAQGGTADASVNSGTEIVASGGHAIQTVNDGTEIISAGGLAQGDINSGLQTVFGQVSNISNYGNQQVSSGGVASGTADYGSMVVASGGLAVSAAIYSGGTFTLDSGADARFATVNAGGVAIVSSGGVASATTITAQGTLLVDGGVAQAGGVRALGVVSVAAGSISGVDVAGEVILGATAGSAMSFAARVESGGVLFVGSDAVESAAVLLSGATEVVDSGGTAMNDVVTSGGLLDVYGASHSGQAGGVASNTVVQSGGVVLELGSSQYNTISSDLQNINIVSGGTIELSTIAYSVSNTGSLDTSTDVYTISAGGTTTEIQLLGNYNGLYAHLTSGALGGTDVTFSPVPCFCRGTRIATDRGAVAVEALEIGDRLLTLSGAARVLRWIGRRAYDGRFAAANRDVLPVTFRAGSLAEGLPVRDLSVSPLHAMFVDGVLIPAIALVDGDAVTQAETVDRVEYFHLELDSHDVLLAEGVAAESYVEDGNRGMFHNAPAESDRPRAPARYCAPRVEDGPVLEAVRLRLRARRQPGPASACRGYLEHAGRGQVLGWAADAAQPSRRVRVVIRDRGVVLGCALADQFRPDLAAAGIGDGVHGFVFEVPGGLSPAEHHRLTAETEEGVTLEGEIALDLTRAPMAAPDLAVRLRAHVDRIERDRVLGWAIDDAAPEQAVAVQILVDGAVVASVLANRFRRDVADAGIGRGRHAFEHHFQPPLDPVATHVVSIRTERDGIEIGQAVLAAGSDFNPDLEQAVARAVGGVAGQPEAERVLHFLARQTDRLRQLDARAEAGLSRREVAAHRGEAAPRRALIIDGEWPDPTRDAGSVAILSHAAALSRAGYAVSLTAARQLDLPPPALLAAHGITACAAPRYASVEEILARQENGFDLVLLHRVSNAARYLMLARDYQPGAQIVFSIADLHHVRLARQASVLDLPECLAEAQRLERLELQAAAGSDLVMTHSPVEAAMLRARLPGRAVAQVPWAVPMRAVAPIAGRAGIGFIGNFAHAPNRDALLALRATILPALRESMPDLVCHVFGPGADPALADAGCVLHGQVPDLGPWLDRLRLTVAPLRFGAGIKGKVLESLAAGVPCVASAIAAEGIGLPDPLVAAETDGFIAATRILLHDDAAWRASSRAGAALVAANWSEAALDRAMAQALSLLEPGLRRAG